MLNENIKKYRKIKGLSQKQLADKVGISGAFMSLIEQGKSNPSDENLEKIAIELGVSSKQLLQDEETDPDIEMFNLLTELTYRDKIKWEKAKSKNDDIRYRAFINETEYQLNYWYDLRATNDYRIDFQIIKNGDVTFFDYDDFYYEIDNLKKAISIYEKDQTQVYRSIKDLQDLLNEDE